MAVKFPPGFKFIMEWAWLEVCPQSLKICF